MNIKEPKDTKILLARTQNEEEEETVDRTEAKQKTLASCSDIDLSLHTPKDRLSQLESPGSETAPTRTHTRRHSGRSSPACASPASSTMEARS